MTKPCKFAVNYNSKTYSIFITRKSYTNFSTIYNVYVYMWEIKSLSFFYKSVKELSLRLLLTNILFVHVNSIESDHVKNDLLLFFRISVHEKKGRGSRFRREERICERDEKQKDDEERPWKKEMLTMERKTQGGQVFMGTNNSDPLIETYTRKWIKTVRMKFVEISGTRNLFLLRPYLSILGNRITWIFYGISHFMPRPRRVGLRIRMSSTCLY